MWPAKPHLLAGPLQESELTTTNLWVLSEGFVRVSKLSLPRFISNSCVEFME